jgi:two-component system, LytTR family, response regulator
MIKTILLENETKELNILETKIRQCCPYLEVNGVAQTAEGAKVLLENKAPELAFINPDIPLFDLPDIHNGKSEPGMELIFVSDSPAHTLDAIHSHAAGYLFRPINDDALINAAERAREHIVLKKERAWSEKLLEKLLKEKKASELIGIPTMEGYEFVSANEIIRCEGLQKCTRVVTTTKTDIISSYNIGEFIKLLGPYHFFSPHKSHLINLAYIRRYLREGTIVLKDKTSIPVSKRRKNEFLNRVVHL